MDGPPAIQDYRYEESPITVHATKQDLESIIAISLQEVYSAKGPVYEYFRTPVFLINRTKLDP